MTPEQAAIILRFVHAIWTACPASAPPSFRPNTQADDIFRDIFTS